ncbi:MAG TPA: hypothetical protein VK428_10805 [Acidimicrobiales bacterium]|nr:hypothetical protein [Acidimicrobiales bacterium]
MTSGYTSRAGPAGPSVQWARPYSSARASSRAVQAKSALRVKAWIVRSIASATTTFALLDLYLLASSRHL